MMDAQDGIKMINKFYEGMGNLGHAKSAATRILKDKKIGTELNIKYYNGYAKFIRTRKGIDLHGEVV